MKLLRSTSVISVSNPEWKRIPADYCALIGGTDCVAGSSVTGWDRIHAK